MDANPYQSPAESPKGGVEPPPAGWHPLTFAYSGFAIGTALVAPLVLAVNPFDRLIVGAAIGGPIGAILGFAFGERRRNAENFNGEEHAESE